MHDRLVVDDVMLLNVMDGLGVSIGRLGVSVMNDGLSVGVFDVGVVGRLVVNVLSVMDGLSVVSMTISVVVRVVLLGGSDGNNGSKSERSH